MKGMYHIAAGTLADWKHLQLTKEIFIDRKPKAYSMEPGNGEPLKCQMTMRECFKLWGVPMDDEEGSEEKETNGTQDAGIGTKRKAIDE